MADDSLEMTVGNNSLELEVNPPYVGSAFSPEVDIEETESTITVTITDARGEHSYSVPNPESAIADAEAATTVANAAASSANSAASAATTAKNNANAAASAATSAASAASDAADLAEEKAGVAVQAASDAASAAEVASAKATLANTAATAANAAASAAGNAASAAISAADYADTATRDASAAADAANSAAGAANAAAAAAASATTTVDAAVASANSAAAYANEKGGAASNAANAANSAASSATSAASAANSAASAASTAATNANSATSAANTATGAANTAATAATSAASAANTAAEAANTAAEYASEFTEAYLPLVTSGAAESLLSTDEQQATFAKRVSEGASVGVHAIMGNTVVMNQRIPTNATTSTTNGITFTNNTDGSWTVNGTATANANKSLAGQINLIAGHKYLAKGCPVGGGTGIYAFKDNWWSQFNDFGSGTIFTCAENKTQCQPAINVVNGITVNNLVFWPQLFDLTQMFGAGNEPSTVAEFEALYPEAYYAYDAGSLLSVNISGITSEGVTREIPVLTYFPNGLRSAGTACDALYRDHYDTVIGSVDLGSLTWTKHDVTEGTLFRSSTISGSGVNYNGMNLVTSAYTTVHPVDKTNGTLSCAVNHQVDIIDNSYSDADAFKSAMSGVYLYYELATPTTTEIDPPINMDYPTENGGVESIVVPTGEMSAPMPLVYVQGYDANGVADRALSVIAPLEGAKASTNYAIGAFFVHDGKLYKATSAIATGEAITPGTNCTQTTVMAEILALA